MNTKKKKPEANRKFIAKAQEVLEFAERKAEEVTDWLELTNALYNVNGKATLAFPTEAERDAFCKTKEFKRILKLMRSLPSPPVKGEIWIRATP